MNKFRHTKAARISSRQVLLAAVCTLLSLSAYCTEIEFLKSPALENSSLSRVVTDEADRVYLSWVQQEDGSAKFFFSRLASQGWTRPQLISEGDDWFINWADFPALSINSENIAALWLKMSAEGTYDYDIQSTFYHSATDEWSEEQLVHSDGVHAEHGFVSLLPLNPNHTMVSWLDGRETANEESAGAMTLRAAIFDPLGRNINEWELDHSVCDCCQTSTALSAEGPIVVYRDRSESEIRDIYLTRYSEGQWTEPKAVHKDNWQISGCPVNGPAVAADGDSVAVAWFNAKDDSPAVNFAISKDSGDSFSAPILVASPETNGRVDLVLLESGRIAVSWIDTSRDEAQIMLSLFDSAGGLVEKIKVADSSASRRSGFPIIEAAGENVFVTWTDISESPQVKVAKINFD